MSVTVSDWFANGQNRPKAGWSPLRKLLQWQRPVSLVTNISKGDTPIL